MLKLPKEMTLEPLKKLLAVNPFLDQDMALVVLVGLYDAGVNFQLLPTPNLMKVTGENFSVVLSLKSTSENAAKVYAHLAELFAMNSFKPKSETAPVTAATLTSDSLDKVKVIFNSFPKTVTATEVFTVPVILRDAVKVGQKVFGTSANSFYVCVARTARVKIAARLVNDTVSVRAECVSPHPEDIEALEKAGLTGKKNYSSLHVNSAGVSPARILGAILFDTGLDFEEIANGAVISKICTSKPETSF